MPSFLFRSPCEQMIAAGLGWAVWSVLGPGYVSAAVAMAALILLMILLDVVHPPAVITSLAFSLRPDKDSSLVLFALAIAITAALVLLQRAVSWLVSRRS